MSVKERTFGGVMPSGRGVFSASCNVQGVGVYTQLTLY